MPNGTQHVISAIQEIIDAMPKEWLSLTTHRLDIYDESQAKTQFVQSLLSLINNGNVGRESLSQLPTAFDYVRLGHQLSSVYEWGIGQINGVQAKRVISFASKTMSFFAVLRSNKERNRKTVVYHDCPLPSSWLSSKVQSIYGYTFETQEIDAPKDMQTFEDCTSVYITNRSIQEKIPSGRADIIIHMHTYGSTLLILDDTQADVWISKIQHVRRRETIAVTPPYSLRMLKELVDQPTQDLEQVTEEDWNAIEQAVLDNTGATIRPLIATSGLSVQYGILMGLLDYARTNHPGKPVQLIIPPNCYGGTNDQARRISAMADDVDVVDLPVDDGKDMTQSLEVVLSHAAQQDAVPIILVEIPTNPRVEVPDMVRLGTVLEREYNTPQGKSYIAPIFIVDQTFCPNVRLLHDQSTLANVQTFSFSSGSKFPSGGRCTAGYVTANSKAKDVLSFVETHLGICDNFATPLQIKVLAHSMPSMKERIQQAFVHTQTFVRHIEEKWPKTKISFIREDLIEQGFTPSVFSLDLPEKGETPEEREVFKRAQNLRLIAHIVEHLPNDAKHCVSYGQLTKSYWTVPATSTQGTTKEEDKDYVVRVALPPNIDIDTLIHHFDEFCLRENI